MSNVSASHIMKVIPVILLYLMTACTTDSSPSRLQAYLSPESHPSAGAPQKLPTIPPDGLPLWLAFLPDAVEPSSITLSEDSWTRLEARTGHEVQTKLPVKVQGVVRLGEFNPEKGFEQLKTFGKDHNAQYFLLVLVSNAEVKTPAYFYVVPEVSELPGYQVKNHASIELALVDTNSEKLVTGVRGSSYATLEQLDVPLESNRYPAVFGTSMANRIFPPEDRALDILRMVAMDEALDQAVMKLENEWRKARMEQKGS